MLGQPAEAPPPLGPIAATEPVQLFRRAWSGRNASPGRTLRTWAGRISGKANRRLLHAMAETTDVIAAQCDLLAERMAEREAVSADIIEALGEELTLLRAEVAHLQRIVGHPPASSNA